MTEFVEVLRLLETLWGPGQCLDAAGKAWNKVWRRCGGQRIGAEHLKEGMMRMKRILLDDGYPPMVDGEKRPRLALVRQEPAVTRVVSDGYRRGHSQRIATV